MKTESMKVGDKVKREPNDWIFGKQDCFSNGEQCEGVVTSKSEHALEPWVDVTWETGYKNNYPEKLLLLVNETERIISTPETEGNRFQKLRIQL